MKKARQNPWIQDKKSSAERRREERGRDSDLRVGKYRGKGGGGWGEEIGQEGVNPQDIETGKITSCTAIAPR